MIAFVYQYPFVFEFLRSLVISDFSSGFNARMEEHSQKRLMTGILNNKQCVKAVSIVSL